MQCPSKRSRCFESCGAQTPGSPGSPGSYLGHPTAACILTFETAKVLCLVYSDICRVYYHPIPSDSHTIFVSDAPTQNVPRTCPRSTFPRGTQDASRAHVWISGPLADGCAFAIWRPIQDQQLAASLCSHPEWNQGTLWMAIAQAYQSGNLPALHSDTQFSIPYHSLLPPHHLQNPDEKGHSCQLIKKLKK